MDPLEDRAGFCMRIKFLMEKITIKGQRSRGRNTFIVNRSSNGYKLVESVNYKRQ